MQAYILLGFVFVGVNTLSALRNIDFSQPVTVSQVSCLSSSHDKIGVHARIYMGENNGMFDYNGCTTINTTKHYNNIYPHLYMVPSAKSNKSGEVQANEVMNGINGPHCALGIKQFSIWVRSPKDWHSNPSKNIEIINDIINAAIVKNWVIDSIYTNVFDWRMITNDFNSKIFNQYINLWWSNAPSTDDPNHCLDDFKTFGGWTAKDIKYVQYAKKFDACRITCNMDHRTKE